VETARAPVLAVVSVHQIDETRPKEARMKKTIRGMPTAAGMSVLVLFTIMIGAKAQNIENGVGVVCDSPQQVEQFITLRTDSKSAVEQINTQSKSPVCEILNIAFLVGAVFMEASNDKGTWQIRKILIVGIFIGPMMSSVQPYQKYTAFLTSKAAPI
jgi:hypothetical protein